VHVTGNIKYDLEIPPEQVAAGRELRARWGAGRPVWIAGSTHEGEEDAALAAHSRLRQRHPDALLLLVPRHPQRFDAVRSLLRRQGVAHALRSTGAVPQAEDSVYLIDTLGELQMLYASADVAFVGGSLVPVGGHSLLEPAVLGLPILSGPHTHNAPDIAALLQQCGALKIVASSERLGGEVLAWFGDPESARLAGSSGQQAVAANRGAVGRLLALLEPRLSPPAASASRSGAAESPAVARSAAPTGSSAER
jgi:3-deoxy-D-manno-octulosonic-acid transferase